MPVTTRELYDWHVHPSGQRYIPAEGGRAKLIRKTHDVHLKSDVWIARTGGSGKKAFQACVQIGGLSPGWSSRSLKRASSFSHSCMFGQNPRAALAAALSRAVRQMKKRQGAFARYR